LGYSFLEQQVNNEVGVVWISRPPANALNVELLEELHSVVDELTANENVRAVIFTGNGPFFAGGADIKMMEDRKGETLPSFMEAFTVHLQRLFNKIEDMSKPVIVAINGHATGGGCELALACDFRFMAGGNAKIGLPEVRLGLLPGAGGIQRLARLLGKARAMEMIVNGLLLSAEEALKIGLVHKVFDPDQLLNRTTDYAKGLATQATLAIGMIKRCINKGLDTNLMAGLSLDIECQDRLFKSQDAAEGIAAFIEKRAAHFRGK
jgi:enoyl-CoA hydratase